MTLISSTQLPLALPSHDDCQFDDFLLTRSNKLAVNTLKKLSEDESKNNSEPVIYLSGEKESGKTHLLHACCHALMQRGEQPVYLSLEQPHLSPAALDQLEHHPLICLDDLDAVMGQAKWEEALFHFYNRAQEQKTTLLLAATTPPSKIKCGLPDLKSRLCHGLSINIKGLRDSEKIYVLQQKARKRGIELNIDVCAYLLKHYSKSMNELTQSMHQLDQASLIQQRKLTIPFVKSILHI